jgi:hypothetical protein
MVEVLNHKGEVVRYSYPRNTNAVEWWEYLRDRIMFAERLRDEWKTRFRVTRAERDRYEAALQREIRLLRETPYSDEGVALLASEVADRLAALSDSREEQDG